MRGINRVTIAGHLGRDPEVRHTKSDTLAVTLSVATSEKWTDRESGEERQATEWHRIVIFNPGLASIAADYLKSGDKVYIEGKLQTRKWTDDAGQDRYVTEVVLQPYRGVFEMLGSARGWDTGPEAPPPGDTQRPDDLSAPSALNGSAADQPHGDEIPF
ncbi:single-stranded DNA-binding protein [Kordiimonas pumila]|uniref:Single-stranded DNA-binding protein n=1 Tax=Kordiimonas pumila TaxID=2161677 RepID=A0ABV7D5T6_9PROT|nr:single-stranded DNA-binding protein [Kordiimonas pumila]